MQISMEAGCFGWDGFPVLTDAGDLNDVTG